MNLADCRALLGHAEWADALVWKTALGCGLEDAELRAKLHHAHMVQWAYLHVWRGEMVKPRELGTFATLAAVRGWAREYYRELAPWLGGLGEEDLAREIRLPWADRLVLRFGKVHPATLAESVLQVAMHSGHHRGQVAQRLRRLDAPLPVSDFIAWVFMGRPKADWGAEDAA